jgi:DNA-binding NarL/FixJ family response regulator
MAPVSNIKPTTHRPSVLLADDHPGTAKQMRALLEQDFDVISVVEDGLTLVSEAARLSPGVIVTDISMPRLDGIDAAVQILRGNPQARIVFVTVHSEPLLVQRGLAAGAFGYVLKDVAGDELLPAAHAALRGERYVSAAVGRINGKKDPN